MAWHGNNFKGLEFWIAAVPSCHLRGVGVQAGGGGGENRKKGLAEGKPVDGYLLCVLHSSQTY